MGEDTRIGTFVEIQKNATISALQSQFHTFICEGVTIEDECFIGHHVCFVNDKFPRATKAGVLQTDADWQVVPLRRRIPPGNSDDQQKNPRPVSARGVS